ncbi:hypothetical protein FNF31_01282 [Cafeteria roenbergensis]|uniref:ADP-ribosylation factor-like protein 2-binding protein n=1 Tax=Cafeteria roenbergensis TaxID=33653 RepID=A0A5A8DP80_CAFRO|nr:hypothetical protein FNF31_01282 [Cafeteria roenbergensis]
MASGAMRAKSLIGAWRGGPNNNLVRIEVKPDGTCVGSWAVPDSHDRGFMTGKLTDGGTKFAGTWSNPPSNLDPRGNTFTMSLADDGDSWECRYTSRGGGSGTWEGRRAGGPRKPGSKLSTRGAASNRDVFERLVAPKSREKAEAEREAVLGESIRTALSRTGAGFDALGDGAPSLAVGDPYLDRSALLSASTSRQRGRQLQGGAPSAFRGDAPQGATDTRDTYMSSPFEDRAELSRRLRRERLAKAKANGVGDRPAFSPASKDPGASALFGAPTLSSVPPGTVGKGLFELARERRQEAARPRRRRAADPERERPAFSSAAASSLGPLARQKHWGLTLTDEEYARASAAVDRAEEGRARREALARDAIMVPEFRERVDAFCKDNCGSFGAPEGDAGEGYKLEWTDLFHQYTAIVESHIEAALVAAVPDFDMEWFMGELESRGDSGAIDGEVFDLLLSLGDFEDFVSLMRCHKQEQDAVAAAAAGDAPGVGPLAATAALGLAPVVSRAPADSPGLAGAGGPPAAEAPAAAGAAPRGDEASDSAGTGAAVAEAAVSAPGTAAAAAAPAGASPSA